MDAYRCGLNGKQAAWANHQMGEGLPESIMQDLDNTNINRD